jgi:thioredoxin reductase (NADPH)
LELKTMSEDIYGKNHKVVIAGSGPAGLTAALYAARADLAPLVIEGFEAGGQLTTTTDVENYPGFPDGVMGPELVEKMRAQAERFGARFLRGDIRRVDLAQRPFTLHLEGDKSVGASTLIVSTGASAKWLGLEAETRLRKSGGGVTACATCDGAFYRGKAVHVIGGGDTAMEEASFLTKFCTRVTIIHRRDALRASKIMQQRAMDNPKIDFIWNAEVLDILTGEGDKIRALMLKDTKTGERREVASQGLFLAIGHQPNTAFLAGQLETDAHGFLLVKHPTTATNVPGVFACGDVMDPVYRQAITAAGTGCRAAIDAEHFLERMKAEG